MNLLFPTRARLKFHPRELVCMLGNMLVFPWYPHGHLRALATALANLLLLGNMLAYDWYQRAMMLVLK